MENLKNIITSLTESPVFNMSLGSKELFHSNFIAWVLDESKDKRINGVEKLLKKFHPPVGSLSIRKVDREVKHFDLRIWLKGKTEHRSILIENKVKSIPDENQLKAYILEVKKNRNWTPENTTCILLSLTAPGFFKERDEWEADGFKWHFISYKGLSEALGQLTTSGYSEFLIKDYINFIDNLCKLYEACIASWKPDSVLLKYKTEDYGSLEEIRMHDIYEKWRMGEIQKRLECRLEDTSGIEFDIGYSNAQGLLGVLPKNYKSREGYFYSIQIQGNQLRQVLKSNKPKGDGIFKEAKSRMEVWFLDNNNEPLQENTHKDKITQYGFCKFDSTFAYRHEELSGLERIVDLIKKMEELNSNA